MITTTNNKEEVKNMSNTYNENSIRTLNYRDSARESIGMYLRLERY